MTLAERFERLPTAAKLLLILSAVLLPIGIALTWIGEGGIRQANNALEGRRQDQSRATAKTIDSLLARNALALRVAANGVLALGPADACARMQRTLSIAPAVAQRFELEDMNGRPLCAVGQAGDTSDLALVAPGNIGVGIAPTMDGIAIRAGVIGGMATAIVPLDELRTAAAEPGDSIAGVSVSDGQRELQLFGDAPRSNASVSVSEWPLGDGKLVARVASPRQKIATVDRLVLLLPVLMWIAAALITWLLVRILLI